VTSTRSSRARLARAAAALVAGAVALTALAACSPLDGIHQANAERILDDAIGDAGTASVRYEHRFAAGLTCASSAQIDAPDAAVITAIAEALARIETEDVLPDCDLWTTVRVAGTDLSIMIDAVTAARIAPSEWEPILAFALDSGANSVSAIVGRDDGDELAFFVDRPETVDFVDLVEQADPLLRAEPPAVGFQAVTLTVRGCGPTYWGPMADGTEGSPTYGAEIELEGSGYGSTITKCIGTGPTIRVALPVPADVRAAIDGIAAESTARLGPLDAVTGDIAMTTDAAGTPLMLAELRVWVRADSTVVEPPTRPEVLATAEAIRDAVAGTGIAYSLTVVDLARRVLEASSD